MPERQSRDIVANEPSRRQALMTVERGVLLRFMALYAALFSAFGFASPFLPAFLAERGLGPEELGFVLGASTALQLLCGPIAGRLGDRLQAFRAELAVCAILAAGAAFLYLAAYGFWTVMAVRLLQAAALAPLVPLADALSLAHARPGQNTGGFEYGWVRGVGSAAFVAGTLLAGQAAGDYGLSAIIWLSATALLATPIAARFVPGFPENAARDKSNGEIPHRPWLTLLRQRAFVRVTLVASLVLGSHAMYDSFAVIRWTQAGISPATIGVLWAESVAAEVLVLLFLGPRLVARDYADCRIGGGGILRPDALGGLGADGRCYGTWTGPALARIHICAPPPRIHAHHYRHGAASFGRNRAGGLWSRRRRRWDRGFDAAFRMALCAFRTGRVLGDGGILHGRISRHLAAASGACCPGRSAQAALLFSLTHAPPSRRCGYRLDFQIAALKSFRGSIKKAGAFVLGFIAGRLPRLLSPR
jgi:MFS transporter, PPP family, 3-phenylpropionic acid transporter